MAPVWLLDTSGQVRPEFSSDYSVKGSRAGEANTAPRDRKLAFANIALVPEMASQSAFLHGSPVRGYPYASSEKLSEADYAWLPS